MRDADFFRLEVRVRELQKRVAVLEGVGKIVSDRLPHCRYMLEGLAKLGDQGAEYYRGAVEILEDVRRALASTGDK